MDFKGYFRCGNRNRCDPFTITDGYSRYIIRCQTVPKMDFEHVDAICEAAMREFGLPDGYGQQRNTFATMGLLGLSKLSIKWQKLGIVHERITLENPNKMVGMKECTAHETRDGDNTTCLHVERATGPF